VVARVRGGLNRPVLEYRVQSSCLVRQSLATSAMTRPFLANSDATTMAFQQREHGLFVVIQKGGRGVPL
jgi:hypothetical protein